MHVGWAAVAVGVIAAASPLLAFLAYLRFCRFVITERKGRPGALGDVPEAMRAFPILGRRAPVPDLRRSVDGGSAEPGRPPSPTPIRGPRDRSPHRGRKP
ncbi:MAG: hypothetical protein QOE03_1911 [Micromonosporaceae bacterium]|nr:hypothetical protein [Micromonosporaceae bacterium]